MASKIRVERVTSGKTAYGPGAVLSLSMTCYTTDEADRLESAIKDFISNNLDIRPDEWQTEETLPAPKGGG